MADALPDGFLLADRYRIVSCLGQGGFGISYEAIDVRLERRVAVKEHFPDGAIRTDSSITWSTRNSVDSVGGLDRFLSEARLLAKIGQRGHPGIVVGHDVFEANQTAYLVMEFLDGQTLEGSVTAHGPVDYGTLQEFAVALCESLSVIHKLTNEDGHAFLHQDVSPANVLVVAREGTGRYRPVLIDFGASRAFAATQSTNATQIVKVGYSPIEGYSAQAERGPGTDLYGLGATLYFCATGVQPVDAMARLTGVPLSPVRELAPTLSEDFATAIEWAMQPSLRDRPRSADQLANALRSVGGSGEPAAPSHRPIAGPNADANKRIRIDSNPNPVVVAAPPQLPLAAVVSKMRNTPLIWAGVVGVLAASGLVASLLSKGDTKRIATVADSVVAVATETSDGSDVALDTSGTAVLDASAPGASEATSPSIVIQPVSAVGWVGRPVVTRNCTGERKRFDAAFLIDGDSDTGWGVSRQDGSGASIVIGFGRSTRITNVGLTPGFLNVAARSDIGCSQTVNAFTYNRFIEQVKYRFDDGTEIVQNFVARPELQWMEIPPVTTTNVTITILSTSRPIGADNDTIISDAAFMGTQ